MENIFLNSHKNNVNTLFDYDLSLRTKNVCKNKSTKTHSIRQKNSVTRFIDVLYE